MAATDISELSGRQLARARLVFDIACEYLDRDPDVVKGTLATVNDESSFVNWGNDGTYAGLERAAIWGWYGGQATYKAHMRLSMLYQPDAMAGAAETTKDSVGLLQQREMYGYAGMGRSPDPTAVARIMQPEYQIRVFIEGVPGQPTAVHSWLDPRMPKGLTISQKCQWVQGSEYLDGGNYADAMRVADQLIEKFGGLPTTETDWITEMAADPAALDAFRAQIKSDTAAAINESFANGNNEAAIGKAVASTQTGRAEGETFVDLLAALYKQNQQILAALQAKGV